MGESRWSVRKRAALKAAALLSCLVLPALIAGLTRTRVCNRHQPSFAISFIPMRAGAPE